MAEATNAEPRKAESSNGTTGERGTQYPAHNLEAAVTMLEKVRSAVGLSAANRETIAAALGYRVISGHASRRLGALSHFDLIERAGKGAARISALGKSILIPTTGDERRLALAEAAKRPNLYAALIARFAGHALPTMLPNLLVREYGIHVSVAEQAAATFRETVEFAGLLRIGVLHTSVAEGDPENGATGTGAGELTGGTANIRTAPEESRAPNRNPEAPPATLPPVGAAGAPAATVLLDNTGRTATVYLPLPITKRDLRKLEMWLNYMKSVVEDEDDETPGTSGN